MKKFLLVCLLSVIGIVANAKDKTTTLTTTTFCVNIDCEGCVKKINDNVSALGNGIEEVDVNLKNKEVKVIYNAKKNSDKKIIAGFSKIDINASVKTEQTAATSSKTSSNTSNANTSSNNSSKNTTNTGSSNNNSSKKN